MNISSELKQRVDQAVEGFLAKRLEIEKKLGHQLGETCAPEADLRGQCEVPQRSRDYYQQVAPLNAKLDELLIEGIRQLALPDEAALKIPREKVWVWGGPTPYWFGSTAEDTLIRGADFFGVKNVVYVGGPVQEKYLAMLNKYEKVLVQMTNQCRAKGFQPESNEECTENVSRFSLMYPNIIGGMMDDAAQTEHNQEKVIPAELFRKFAVALRKYNSALTLSSVIYSHELWDFNFTNILPFLDRIVLWFWSKQELLEFDRRFAKCRKIFPGKELLLGIFMHDYGCADLGTPPECLRFQLGRAASLIRKGKLDGIVILGDREIRKWPAAAQTILDCLL